MKGFAVTDLCTVLFICLPCSAQILWSRKHSSTAKQFVKLIFKKPFLKSGGRSWQEVVCQTSQLGCSGAVMLLVFCCSNSQHVIWEENFCNLELSHNNFIFEERIGYQSRCGWLNLNVFRKRETKKRQPTQSDNSIGMTKMRNDPSYQIYLARYLLSTSRSYTVTESCTYFNPLTFSNVSLHI